MIRSAFTLMELLVVLVVISILASMMFIGQGPDPADAALRQAAIELRSTIQKARSLAMQSQQTHAITFNIEAPVESDGTVQVLRNFTDDDPDGFQGRHWYAIIGPADHDRLSSELGVSLRFENSVATVPFLSYYSYTDPRSAHDARRQTLIEVVKDHQIGPRRYLPRTVRFLALSDLDGGGDILNNPRWDEDLGNWGRSDPGMVYPVPWHGLVHDDGGRWRLVPWGFYDDDLARTGLDGTLSSPDSDSDKSDGVQLSGTMSAWGAGPLTIDYPNPWGSGTRSMEVAYDHFLYTDATGTRCARLIEGATMDATLLFKPDGSVHWKHDYQNKRVLGYNGEHQWYTASYPSNNAPAVQEWGSLHQTDVTGGFHITLARDVDESAEIYPHSNFHEFANRSDALESITPFLRVYVEQRSGLSEIRDGLRQAPPDLDWVADDGTVHTVTDMPSWRGVDPYCRVQQWQKLYNGGAGDTDNARPYHLPEQSEFITFKPAGQY